MDGYEATREIRRREADARTVDGGPTALPPLRIPVIAMTAAALMDDRNRCHAAGMDDYVSKPFEPEQLAATLRRWLGDEPAPHVAVPASISMAEEITDRLERLRGHLPPEGIDRLLASFVDDGRRCLSELETAYARTDTAVLAAAAHAFKGASAAIGATSIVALCDTVERWSAARAVDAVGDTLARLRVEYERAKGILHTFSDSGSLNAGPAPANTTE
jgi:two-component system sensor histidine kinase/response regulator